MLYRQLIAPLLFARTKGDPEVAHANMLSLLATISRSQKATRILRRVWDYTDPSLSRFVFGINFPNPVGLAAGYDKDGVALPALESLGFGFLEIGTVTRYPQPGNPRPRIFRFPAQHALVNRMGFNNNGAEAMATTLSQTLANTPPAIPIAISIGKSRRTPLEEAIEDYCTSLRTLYPYGTFFTVNVSSPNTPGLRSLQNKQELNALIAALQEQAHALSTAEQETSPKPLLVKIAPDLSNQAIAEVLDVCANHHISGIIATNTMRVGDESAYPEYENGGMSGKPLTQRAREVVQFIHRETNGTLPIIGVGGICTPDDALRMLDAGASLLQVYTGLIYEGPGIVRNIKRAIMHHA